jgi:hypothetical protein
MERITAIVCSGCATLLLAGCGAGSIDSMDEGPSGEVAQEIEVSNAMNPNAMNPNAMNPNAMNPNAMNPNALSPSAMSASAMLALQDPGPAGDLSRQLLKYTVSCALDSTQSFSFSWTDALGAVHDETYPGLLGLATTWATRPLEVTGQRWVTACLASRVNWYGTPVMLSSRAAHPNLSTQSAAEQSAFPREEGAFFGNVFTESPAVYACYNASNVAHSHSLFRDCASGHVDAGGAVVDCGPVQVLGDCADYCAPLDAAGLYHPSCASVVGGSSLVNVVTTYLP